MEMGFSNVQNLKDIYICLVSMKKIAKNYLDWQMFRKMEKLHWKNSLKFLKNEIIIDFYVSIDV
jgi:hypothetical protein